MLIVRRRTIRRVAGVGQCRNLDQADRIRNVSSKSLFNPSISLIPRLQLPPRTASLQHDLQYALPSSTSASLTPAQRTCPRNTSLCESYVAPTTCPETRQSITLFGLRVRPGARCFRM